MPTLLGFVDLKDKRPVMDVERGVRWVEENMDMIIALLGKDDRIIPERLRRKKRKTTVDFYDSEDSWHAVGNLAAEARVLEEIQKVHPTVSAIGIRYRLLDLGELLFHDGFAVIVGAKFG